jgi:hypothetical protein
MMQKSVLLIALLAAALPAFSHAEEKAATAAADTNAAALEVRADQHFLGGEWAQALPMYKKLAEMAKNDPGKLGPIEERIRVCEKNIAKLARVTPSAAAAPTATPVVVPAAPPTGEQRKPHPVPKDGETLDITIKQLGNFDFDQEKGGNIPDDVKRLSGHPVKLRGFMIPMDQADSITQFALVPSLFACCFGQPPQIQHTIIVNCPKGKAVSYFPDEIQVEGTLKVDEKKEDGFIVSIFEMDCQSVKPAAR